MVLIFLSDILTNSKLKKSTINDSPSNTLGSLTILLDGNTREVDGVHHLNLKEA